MTQTIHLSSGAHSAIDSALTAHYLRALGTPSRVSARHVCWNIAPSAQPDALAQLQVSALSAQHDVAVLPTGLGWKDFSLLAMDMDSTLINIECIDEIADYCGKRAAVSAITEAAMRGEITDYQDSLRRRVALLKGLPVSALEAVLRERLKLNPGAEALVKAAHAHGVKTLLVSGGFTFFTDAMQARLKLSHSRSNVLIFENGCLTGEVAEPIIDAAAKRDTVQDQCAQLGVASSRAIAMGDGSNDLAMMAIAGLSVAYHAKPAVLAQATAAIRFGGLDTLGLWLGE